MQDRIAITHVTSWPWQEGLVLVIVKGGFVIIFYLYEDLEKQEYSTYKCSDVTVNGEHYSIKIVSFRFVGGDKTDLSALRVNLAIFSAPPPPYPFNRDGN